MTFLLITKETFSLASLTRLMNFAHVSALISMAQELQKGAYCQHK